MDASRFDRITRLLSSASSRRGFVAVLASAFAFAEMQDPTAVAVKQRKKKPLRFNEFGCLNVGKPCRGRDELCCSDICEGRRPRKGKKDRSRCVAHDETTCQAGQRATFCDGATDILCTTTLGRPGICNTTTGNAGFCQGALGGCASCTKDIECQIPFGNPQGACIRCVGVCATSRVCGFP